MHGGKSLSGLAHPNTKTGRYSKDLPTRLAGKYEEAQADTELLNLRSEIALVDARTGELLQQIQTGESGRIWEAVGKVNKNLSLSIQAGDAIWMKECLGELNELVSAGQRDYSVWHEISKNIEQRRKLVESERKRLVEMQQMITIERAMLLVAAIVDVVRENVRDAKTLQSISTDITRLVSVDAG